MNQFDQNSKLRDVINACETASKESATEARKYLNFIGDAIHGARKTIQNMKKTSSEGLNSIIKQTEEINSKFQEAHNKVELMIEKKIKETNKFNITLFGRTKVGKSTFMEIVTNGDGKSIGKGGQRTTLDVQKYDWGGVLQ